MNDLENRLNTKLLNRTTGLMSPTESAIVVQDMANGAEFWRMGDGGDVRARLSRPPRAA